MALYLNGSATWSQRPQLAVPRGTVNAAAGRIKKKYFCMETPQREYSSMECNTKTKTKTNNINKRQKTASKNKQTTTTKWRQLG